MIDIQKIRANQPRIVVVGNHSHIIQSVLDFDYLNKTMTRTKGEKERGHSSITAIIAAGRTSQRYFYGRSEISIPIVESAADVPDPDAITHVINISSGRRAYTSAIDALDNLTNLEGMNIFAEDMPEQHALQLKTHISGTVSGSKAETANNAPDTVPWVIGPASVGLMVPAHLKLGAIGGITPEQLALAHTYQNGSIAVLSASGGMTNELINLVTQAGHRISFAMSFGGDRFPLTTPKHAFIAAENDPKTEAIVYYGELGGTDEYDVIELVKNKTVTKPIFTYIAGAISDLFDEPPQFGHAKAIAKTRNESAQAKRKALQEAGIASPDTFKEFIQLISEHSTKMPLSHGSQANSQVDDQQENDSPEISVPVSDTLKLMKNRKKALFASTISGDDNGTLKILGESIVDMAKNHSFGEIIVSMFLGKRDISDETVEFMEDVMKLLVDHGPSVSGVVNTMITARADRDMATSVSAGMLTIGSRFGGALNSAAHNWLNAVSENEPAEDFVERFASEKKYIPGIGHKKYTTEQPDPRVQHLLKKTHGLSKMRHLKYAQEIEAVTTKKRSTLILNVDGAVAAVLIDLLIENEGLNTQDVQKLCDAEFFNAFFVLSRTVGLISHYIDQKRLDEGLFRLPKEHVAYLKD